MTGDQADIRSRIKSLLPPWFGNGDTPVLDAFLKGPSWVLAWVYSLYAYAKLQTRLLTATDGFLDMIAYDFFGNDLRRRGDDDDTYRRRIVANIFPVRNTRHAVRDAIIAVTGNTPTITEGPWTAAITVDPGPATSAEILAAIDAVRPICFVPSLTLTGGGSHDFLTDEAGDLLTDEGGDTLTD